MSELRDRTRQQIEDAYRRMASDGCYRPEAPSDGVGNITVPAEELDLDAEAESYAERWWAEEDTAKFHIGLANFETRPAMIFAVEAARLLCAGTADEAALRLLRMAEEELEKPRS